MRILRLFICSSIEPLRQSGDEETTNIFADTRRFERAARFQRVCTNISYDRRCPDASRQDTVFLRSRGGQAPGRSFFQKARHCGDRKAGFCIARASDGPPKGQLRDWDKHWPAIEAAWDR